MRGLVGFAGELSREQVGAVDRAGLERDGGERPAKGWLGKSWEWIGSPRTVWMEQKQ